MDSITEPPGGSTRSKIGLLVLGLLSIILVIAYLSIRKHGVLGEVNSPHPRMSLPTLPSPAVSPEPLVVGNQHGTFHGASSCVLASINGMNFDRTVTLSHGTVIGLGGWLIDKMSQTAPEQAWVVLAGEGAPESYQVPIRLREKRPDVSQFFGGVAGYTNSGFIVDIASTGLPAGNYRLYIVFKHGDVYYTCDNGRQLKLGQEASNLAPVPGEKNGTLGQVNSAQPSTSPPIPVSTAESPEPFMAGGQQTAFHGTESCVIGSINSMHYDKTISLKPGAVIDLEGWLIDKMSQTVPDQAWIVLAGEDAARSYQVPITRHEKRPDVSQHFGGVAGYMDSGFSVDIASANMLTGTYHIYIVFKHGGMDYTCDNGRRLKLEQDASDPVPGSGGKT